MAENVSELNTASRVTEAILENLRDNLKIARIKNRHSTVDGLRIAPDELENYSINLQSFSEKYVVALAQQIKKHKHAKPAELTRLSHAFLQSKENIQCFLNSTGALNVLIKELTGTFVYLFGNFN